MFNFKQEPNKFITIDQLEDYFNLRQDARSIKTHLESLSRRLNISFEDKIQLWLEEKRVWNKWIYHREHLIINGKWKEVPILYIYTHPKNGPNDIYLLDILRCQYSVLDIFREWPQGIFFNRRRNRYPSNPSM